MGFILIPLELWTQIPKWTPRTPRPVDLWLAAQPRPSAVIEYPFLDNFSARLMLSQTVHQQPLIMGGLPPSFYPRELYQRSDRLRIFLPRPGSRPCGLGIPLYSGHPFPLSRRPDLAGIQKQTGRIPGGPVGERNQRRLGL